MSKIQMELEDFDAAAIGPNVQLMVTAGEAALFDAVIAATDGYETADYDRVCSLHGAGLAVIEHAAIEIRAKRSSVRPAALAIAHRALKPVHNAMLTAAEIDHHRHPEKWHRAA